MHISIIPRTEMVHIRLPLNLSPVLPHQCRQHLEWHTPVTPTNGSGPSYWYRGVRWNLVMHTSVLGVGTNSKERLDPARRQRADCIHIVTSTSIRAQLGIRVQTKPKPSREQHPGQPAPHACDPLPSRGVKCQCHHVAAPRREGPPRRRRLAASAAPGQSCALLCLFSPFWGGSGRLAAESRPRPGPGDAAVRMHAGLQVAHRSRMHARVPVPLLMPPGISRLEVRA